MVQGGLGLPKEEVTPRFVDGQDPKIIENDSCPANIGFTRETHDDLNYAHVPEVSGFRAINEKIENNEVNTKTSKGNKGENDITSMNFAKRMKLENRLNVANEASKKNSKTFDFTTPLNLHVFIS